MSKTIKALLAVAGACALFYFLRPLFACGPTFPNAVFTNPKHPDLPLEKYIRGDLGVLHPAYTESYLYVAYRVLIGTGFDAAEQQVVLAYWNFWLGDRPYSEPQPPAVSDWLAVRKKVAGAGPAPAINAFRAVPKEYFQYLNCPDDAFRAAVDAFKKRSEQFGIGSGEVRDWVQGQDAVFANCSGPQVIPAALTGAANPVIRADRAYQIAAANFYAGNFDQAEEMFRAIARDSSSPWRRIAPYLAARTLVRKATLNGKSSEPDLALLARAEEQLKSVLADGALMEIHPAAARLLDLVRFRLRPEERLQELSQAVLKKGSGTTLKQDLWDFRMLLDRAPRESLSDLPDWIFTFQQAGGKALDHSLEQWEKTPSLPWLVASVSKIGPNHPAVNRLLEAAAKIQPESPAYPSVAFHTVRLLIESGRKDQARRMLDDVLSRRRAAFPQSSVNLLLGERLALAGSFDEFLRFASRVPAAFCCELDEKDLSTDMVQRWLKAVPGRALLDVDSIKVFNQRMPVSLLRDAAKSDALPAHIRRDLALAAWARAALLDEAAIVGDVATVLESHAPEMRPYLSAYSQAASKGSRAFAAVFLMLHFPGTRPYVGVGIGRDTPLDKIDEYRDNWWCQAELSRTVKAPPSWDDLHSEWGKQDQRGRKPEPDPSLPFRTFLTEAQKTAAKREWETVAAIGAAPNYLSRQVLEWAKANPADPRVPEALHLAVRSTRVGCTDKESSKWSRAAFELLHKQYPQSSWAAKTKYWY